MAESVTESLPSGLSLLLFAGQFLMGQVSVKAGIL